MAATISLTRCRRVAAPSRGFYRVTHWHEPFDPPPAPPAIEDEADEREPTGRWDDPEGIFRTLYCATAAEGAIAEKLADFALNPVAAIRVESFMDSDSDDQFVGEQIIRPLDREDIESFHWTLAWAPSEPRARFLDVNHWRTHLATAPAVGELLLRFGPPDVRSPGNPR